MTLSKAYKERMHSGNLTFDENQIKTLQILDNLSSALTKKDRRLGFLPVSRNSKLPSSGLYIWGSVGSGKSMLMDLFYEHTIIKKKRRVHFHNFMQEIHDNLFTLRNSGEADPLSFVIQKIHKSINLLCFDEMQITDITDAMLVGRIFHGLISKGVFIVSTSNRPPKDLYKNGLNRDIFLPFISFIEEKLTVHELSTPIDHRKLKLGSQSVYFYPLNNKTSLGIENLWRTLSGGISERLILSVKGRDFLIPNFKNGIARMAFSDLCEKAHSAVDYLALTKVISILILEDIPIMSPLNLNAAKRFVVLVDTLYDAKIKLICSAQSQPNKLYKKGKGSFEFERTISRLIEMQSIDWVKP
ncbi:MAG: cell division protein ZapE [Proteobacteria bacterium]|jgi:cell division protein ZapE|nr:cell division protein ZapE [Pseudomonadota bacterium]